MRRADRPFITLEEDLHNKLADITMRTVTGAGKTHVMKVNATPEMIEELKAFECNKEEYLLDHAHDMFYYALGKRVSPSVVFKENGEIVVESSINKDAVKLPSMFEVMVKFQNRWTEFETFSLPSGRKKIEVKADKGRICRSLELFPNMTESQCVKELLYNISGFDKLARRDYIEYYGEDDLNQRLEL